MKKNSPQRPAPRDMVFGGGFGFQNSYLFHSRKKYLGAGESVDKLSCMDRSVFQSTQCRHARDRNGHLRGDTILYGVETPAAPSRSLIA